MFPRVPNSSRMGLLHVFVLLFVGLLWVTSSTTVQAAGLPNNAGPAPTDKICVEGSLIDHDEHPLTDGWIVVATPRNAQGDLDLTRVISEVSDSNGNFRFTQFPDEPPRGLYVGDWQFHVELGQKTDQEWEPVTLDHFDVSLTYGKSDCVKIRFKLRRIIKVTLIKVNDDYLGQPNWKFHANPGPGNIFASPQTLVTDDTGTVVFRLSPGRWIFTEEAPPGVSYTPVLPANGMQDVDVRTAVTIYFKNRIRFKGCIEVSKYDVLPNNTQMPLPGWSIQVTRSDGSLATSGVTDLDGTVRFEGLSPGPYIVTEETRLGWKPTTPTSFTVAVAGGNQCQVVTFFNVQDKPQFCIEGIKIDTNGKIGLPGWKIWAEPLDAGDPTPDAVLTDGEGEYTFTLPDDDYRIPNSRYRICEEQRDGWLPHTATCYTVTLPQEPGACVRVPTFENQQKGHGIIAPQPTTEKPGCRSIHTVKPGEALFAIGKQYGVGSKEILKANPWVRTQKHMYVYVGQQICIP